MINIPHARETTGAEDKVCEERTTFARQKSFIPLKMPLTGRFSIKSEKKNIFFEKLHPCYNACI